MEMTTNEMTPMEMSIIEISKKDIMKNTIFKYNKKNEINQIIVYGITFDYKDDFIYYKDNLLDATLINKKEGSFIKFHNPSDLRITIGIDNFIVINKHYYYDDEVFVMTNNYKLTSLDILSIIEKYGEIFKKHNSCILYFDDTKAIIRIKDRCEIQILTTYLNIENMYLIQLCYEHNLYRSEYKSFVYEFFTDFGFKIEKPISIPSILSFIF
jgi:hypothetical protein